MPGTPSPSKRTLSVVLKTAIVLGLLFYLGKKNYLSVEKLRDALAQWRLLLPAVLILLFNQLLGTLRWQWLLRAQGIELSWLRVLQLGFIGNFFNIALPGAVSGDFVKAFYIGRELHGRRGRAFGSILFDRVAGLSALVFVSAGAAIVGRIGGSQVSHSLLNAVRPVIVMAALCVLAFYAYLFLVREHRDPVLLFFRTIEKKNLKFGSLVRIYEGLRHYHNHRLTVLKVLLLSVVIHLIVGWAFLQFNLALGESSIALLPLYVIVPLGLLVTAVPIAPAGVGTGHVAFLYLFGLLGSSRGADSFNLFALTSLLIGALGGLVYLRFRSREPKPVSDANDAIPLA
ncbi:MAG: flippase-like domain-containing protein [Oligoflexia bacterium]|nr:flippase-like domain-containing protein [Oligoflexia bacterium]